MSYQPEERYWTDYLRIALPVIGLLLMLALFWYWASRVIGDNGSSPQPTSIAQVSIVTATAIVPTATVTPDIAVQAQPTATTAADSGPAVQQTNGGTSANSANSAGAASTSSGASASSTNSTDASNSAANSGSGSNPSKFGSGDTVVTSSDNVNMRDDHSIDGNVIESLPTGAELNVTGNGVKGGDYIWIPVDNPASGNSGWVADELVQLPS